MNVELNLSSVEQVSMRQISDGVVTELQGNATTTRRMLNIGRQLSTTVVFNVTNADSVQIIYRNSEDYNSTNMISVEVQDSDDNGSSSSFPIMMILMIALPVLGLVAIIILLCWWRKKCKSAKNRNQQQSNRESAWERLNQIEIHINQKVPEAHGPQDFHFHPEAPVDLDNEKGKNSDENDKDDLNRSGAQALNEYNDTACSI